MPSNYIKDDPIFGQQDLDDYFITDAQLIDRYVGNGLWASGQNNTGQLGLNDVSGRSSPVQVGALTNWRLVSCGKYSTLVTKTDGTLWAWGRNPNGELGDNTIVHRSSPVQVGALTNWKQVSGTITAAALGSHTISVKTDGTLWSWGHNGYGNLGLNDLVHRSSPTQVGALTNWKQVSSAGGGSSAAIKTDGTLWSWGKNSYGNLGLNDIVHRSSPTQVGALTNWKQVAGGWKHVLAIKTDGTLWSWGNNTNGALGQNNTTSYSSPVQVGTLTNWKQVVGGFYYSAAIKTDGTLWSWGQNNFGQLGLNDIVHRSSPVQVGSLTNWKLVSSGDYHIAAIKTDGTLWSWGSGTLGQLGLITAVSRSSPTQVGTLTNWKQVSSGMGSIEAIPFADIT